MAQNGTKKREKAAQLIAQDHLSDEKIAIEVGISRRSLARWKGDRKFIARVERITTAYADSVLRHGLARKTRRLAVLNDLHEKSLQAITDRAGDPERAGVAGGKTGLIR